MPKHKKMDIIWISKGRQNWFLCRNKTVPDFLTVVFMNWVVLENIFLFFSKCFFLRFMNMILPQIIAYTWCELWSAWN